MTSRRFISAALAALASAALPQIALAHPLAPNVDTYMALVASYADCGISNGIDATACASTQDASFAAHVTGIYTNSLVAQASMSATALHAELHSLPAPAKVNNQYIPGGSGYLTGAWFDDITVSGPSPTVQIGVSIHSDGMADRIPGGYSTASWFVGVGTRNPTPHPSYSVVDDFLNFGTLIVRDGGSLFSALHGPSSASIDQTATGTFTANVGSPFELGYVFDIYGFQSNIDFGNTFTIAFVVPEGYTLTSSRGLAVNVPVPEPSTYALLITGLLGIGAMIRRRSGRMT